MPFHKQLRNLSDHDLRRHLELENARGKRGSWVYNINRHQALIDEVKRREREERRVAA
ncbi:MAG TPA: hypothetical protein VFU31_29740 [Candidatus Binatia bacterium]|nr:hypothetical protein [Candidatus Binatia bacterium]